jgi:hypothetical protein
VTTDMTATAAEIVARYASRWSIEVCFHDGKNITGVGETQNRVEKAVQRSVPFTFMAQTITVLWYTTNAKPETQIAERRRNARTPWQRGHHDHGVINTGRIRTTATMRKVGFSPTIPNLDAGPTGGPPPYSMEV